MNIINTAFVRNGVTVRTMPVYQYNRGMILQISGLDDLPSTFRADFANAETGQSKTVIGTDGRVHIPYEYFVPGATIHCWLVWTGADYVVTRKHVMIPIARRATPTDEEPSPDEQGVIDQAIAALNDAVTQTGQDAEAAAGHAEQAEQSAQAAATAKNNAVAAQNAAEAAKDQVVEYASNAAASAQSASESAQSALQSKADAQAAAVSVAGAMDTLEATIQADLQAAKESGMFDGADGVSPTATVTQTTTGATISITDAQGTTTAEISNGQDGEPGTPGTDGISPTIAVTPITDGHQVMITDAEGEHTFDVTDGEPGADGFSPIVTVTQTQTGATISITDKAGTTTAQISNGAKGDPGDDYVLTVQDKAEIAQQAAAEVDVPVQDVQVNGTSILNAQGVANVPEANENVPGVSKLKSSYGIRLRNGCLAIEPAAQGNIKDADNSAKPIVSTNAHVAAFYGLARAAGKDMASSSNPVGTYTDEAKVAIQKMLGIYEAPWELIREDTFTNETEADHIITTDANGEAFELTDVILMFETPQQETYASKGAYGQVSFYFANAPAGYASSNVIEAGNWTQEANTKAKGAFYIIEKKEGLIFFERGNPVGSTSSSNLGIRWETGFPTLSTSQGILPDASTPITFNKINIKSVMGTGHYKLYGKRKWQ